VPREQQIGEAHDRGQQIVEVVGYAARELADRIHLLRLCKTKLEILLLGHIEQIDDGRRISRPVIFEPSGDHLRHALLADTEGEIRDAWRGPLVEGKRKPFLGPAAILSFEKLREIPSGDPGRFHARDIREGPVRLDDYSGPLDEGNPHRRIRKQPGEPRLG